MTPQSVFSNPADKYRCCPIVRTHRRLAEAHLLWHQTLDRYHDADAFRANLNATLEAFRNVTFVLQKEKGAFVRFEEWYEPWQARLKADSAAKWAHDARNTVVHEGELDSRSNAEVRLITWQDEVLATLTVPANTPSSLILRNVQLFDLVAQSQSTAADLKDAALTIERRWCASGLGELELLAALAQVYGLLSDIVLDAHIHLKETGCIPAEPDHTDFRSAYHRTGTLECMTAGAGARTQHFKLSTGEKLIPVGATKRISFGDAKQAGKRYGLDETGPTANWESLDPFRVAEKVLYRAKRILRQDKNHQRMMFIRDGGGDWHLHGLIAEDRTEKHLLMRMVAQFVERKGCDAVIEVGEAWMAPAERVSEMGRKGVEGIPGRSEALFVMVATREGASRTYVTPFKRGPIGGLKLSATYELEEFANFYFQPILDVWRRQGIAWLPNGKAIRRFWEPDALDICFCGGPKRFADCCRPYLSLSRDSADGRAEIDKAIAANEFSKAEQLSRVALAQYVIWIKQHTAPMMNVAQDLYTKFVDMDVPALHGYVNQLQNSLEANGNADSFVPQVRYLSGIIGVPRLSVRLTTLVSHALSRSGKTEEAMLEMEGLGDLEKIDDALALITAVHLLELPAERRQQLLLRASSLARCEEERWEANLALAEDMVHAEAPDRALPVVDSVIAESRAPNGNAGTLIAALILRWKITRAQDDFQSARDAIENHQDANTLHHFAAILIDEGMYRGAEDILAHEISARDAAAMLLITDARIRSGNADSGRDLFLEIDRGRIPEGLQLTYAVASALVALASGDEKIRELAILCLRELPPVPGEANRRIRDLLRALQGEEFGGEATSR